VSIILDALRRRSADHGGGDEAPDRGARADAVLATLGYPRPVKRRGMSVKTLLWFGAGAVLLGFVGLTVLIELLSPSAPPRSDAARRASAAVTRPSSPAARGTAATSGAPIPDPPSSVLRGAADPTGPVVPTPAGSTGRVLADATKAAQEDSAAEAPAASVRALPTPRYPIGTVPTAVARSAQTPSLRLIGTLGPSRPGPRATVDRGAPEPALEAIAPQPPAAPREDHFGLALYYQRVGDFDHAVAHYRALLEQNEASAEVHNNLGLLYEDHGQRDDAVKQFERAIAIDPKSVKAHNNLGVSLMRANQPAAAASEFRVALASDPRNVESLVNLALLQKAAGRVADARDLLRRALAIDPRNAGSHYNLAVVADEGGDAAAAIEHYRAFLRYGAVAHADLVGRVRARLTTLGG
jgi:Tfp pilus assembly protein PilF